MKQWVKNRDLEPGMIYVSDESMVVEVHVEDHGTWVKDDAGNEGYMNSNNSVEVYV